MALEDIVDLAERQLARERVRVPGDRMDSYRRHRVLPGTVLERRSFGLDDDMATALVLADQVELEELRRRVGKGSVLHHPSHLLDAWGLCETLRRLGFEPGQISVGWGSVTGQGDNVVYAHIKTDTVGMTVCVSRLEADSAEEALQGWEDLWKDVMLAGEDELTVALSRSAMGDYRRVVALVAEISRHGIKLPGVRLNQESLTMLAGPIARLAPGGEG